ncbi:MAG TPA: methyltransferase domain-containing protein, partial [Woeseiaceae bacterium]|nr:methyltransferase domain-containing protein [Woeseiaceae bacterium]
LAGVRGRILDACSAPGGKSAHLKELGGDTIELTSIDKDPERLKSVKELFERLGLSATIRPGDASNTDGWYEQKPYDGILLDAPCSASGVIRRHPDIKHLRRPSDISRLAARQSAILRALWPLLRPGGQLLYVTCSVFAKENDAVINDFIGVQGDARERLMLHNNNIRVVMRQKAHGYQILPGTLGMDGFYFACLEKVR